MSAAAGWYADPSGVVGQLRWWDGTRWTDHVTPDPTQVAAVATAGGGTAEASQPPPPTGAPLGTSAQAADQGATGHGANGADATWTASPERPVWQVDGPVPGSGGSSVRTGLIIAAVVGVIVLLIVGSLVVGLFGLRSGEFEIGTVDGFEDLGDRPAASIDTGELRVGQSVSVTIPEEGLFRATLTVDEPGTVVLDVRGEEDFDGVLEVLDGSGSSIAENDDRDQFEEERELDPYLELELDPGTYTVEVRGWSGGGGSFELTAS